MVNFNFYILGALATAASLATAAPSRVVERSPQSSPSFVPTGPEYYLQTKVLSGDATKDGLYVQSYHTGAGLNDVVLTSDISGASKGFMNETYQEFALTGSDFPYGFTLADTEFYVEWLPVEMNGGQGDVGYSLTSDGLTSNNTEFSGWLACDWNHGLPQLFWLFYTQGVDIPVPDTCAKVNLCQVPV